MPGPNQREHWGAVLTALVVGISFFAGGIILGLSVGLLVILLLVTALVTVAVFVLS